MASQDFTELMQLVYFEKWEIEEKEYGVKESRPYAIVRLRRGSKEQEKSSSEIDFIDYVVRLKEVADAEGRIRFQKIRNPEQYDRDFEALVVDEDNKIRKAIQKIASGQFRFNFDVDSGLKKILSGSQNLNDPDIRGVKTHYFEVLASHIIPAVQAAKIIRKQSEKRAEFANYYRIYDEVLRLGFMSTGKRIGLKDYVKLGKSVSFDLLDVVDRTEKQKEYADSMFKILSKEGRLEADAIGIPFILDIYRRFCELCCPFLNMASIALDISSGRRPKWRKYSEVVKTIRESKFRELVDIVKPEVRHCEAHVSTRVKYHPTKKGEVILIDSRKKPPQELGRMNFDEVCEMTHKMFYCLYPALSEGFTLFESALSIAMLKSFEFKTLLASLGQVV